MHLLPNWQLTLKRSWSVRFIALAGACASLLQGWPYTENLLPPVWYSIGGVGLTAGQFAFLGCAGLARLIHQENLK